MAEICKIDFKGKMIDEQEFQEELLSYISKDGSHVEMPQELVEHLLSQVDNHFIFDDSFNDDGSQNHTYYWKNGKSEDNPNGPVFTSGTTLSTKWITKTGIKETTQGAFSRDVGTNYHNMAEDLIKARNEGKSFEEAMAEHKTFNSNKAYQKVARHINELYEEWTADGSTVLSEFKIGNTDKNIAGTVDIAVVHTDGSVSLFDFKGTRHEYGKFSSKTDSNNFQLELYSQILSKGDTKLGIPPLRVRESSVIPIISDIDEVSGKVFLKDAVTEDPISIDNKEVFTANHVWKAKISSILSEGVRPDIKFSSSVDFESFSDNVSSYIGSTGGSIEREAERRARRAEKKKDGKYYYLNQDVHVPFKGSVAANDDTLDGHQARVKELEEIIEQDREASSGSMVSRVIHFFESGYDPYISKEMIEEGDIPKKIRAKSDKLKNLVNRYNKDFDLMVPANEVEGMENIGDDVIVVYKNFNKGTGEHSHIDLLSVDEIADNTNSADNKSNTTIFGNHLTKNHARAIAARMGIPPSTIMDNTRKSNVLMKLGLAAIALKKDNPDMKIGNMVSYSIHNSESPSNPTAEYMTIKSALNHIKIIRNSGNESLKKSFNQEITEMLDADENLLKPSHYQHSELDSLLNFLSLYITTPRQDTEGRIKTNLGFSLKDLLPKESNVEKLRELGAKYREDDGIKRSLIATLARRMKSIEINSENSTLADFRDDQEYRMLSNVVAELFGLTTSFDKIKDLSAFEKYRDSGAFTGVEIVDAFALEVKKAHDMASKELLGDYVVDKKKKFTELFGKNFFNKAIGNTSRYFERLIEQVEVPVVGSNKTVMRKTMRFWDINSEEFKKLPQEHQDFVKDSQEFIEWFNDRVQEAFEKGLESDPKALERFRKGWVRGHIPLMRSSTSNTVFKAVNRMIKGENQGYASGLSTGLKIETDKHQDRSEFFGDKEGTEELVSMFENQVPSDHSAVEDVFGDAVRKERLGLTLDGEAVIASGSKDSDAAHDLLETNLERVLDFLMVGNVSKKHLEPLLPLRKSIETIIHIHENDTLNDLTNIKDYLKVYSDANIHNIRQTNFENKKVEALVNASGSLTSTVAVGWNVYSGMKNFLAGHLHQLENYTASAVAGTSKGKAGLKGYGQTWKYLMNMKSGDSNKLHHIMYSNRFADVDMDKIKQGQNLKAGGQHFLSSRWAYWLNYASDYFHRSHMAITEMINDGVWDAYVEVEVDGETSYKYDETKDPRWKGEVNGISGEERLAAYKKQMAVEGGLDAEGRMITPYTSAEVQRVKKLADNTFESQNMTNNPIYKQYVIGRLFLQMGGWLAAKSERWYKRDHINQELGEWKYVKGDDGETRMIWEGHYMEGMVQTLQMMSSSIYYKFTGKDDRTLSEIWNHLEEEQKKNIGRAAYDIAGFSMLAGLLSLLFDDEEEDTFLFKLLSGSAEEIFAGAHLTAATDLVRSPFPSIAVALNIVNNMLSMDPDKMTLGTLKVMGPAKNIQTFKDMGNDMSVFF